MEGVIDPFMREHFSAIGGFDIMVTEFVRVTQRLLPDKVFYKYSPELYNKGCTSSGTPVYVQLLGSQANIMAENAQRACELNAPGIDLNFGCPAKTVNRHDGGATLLKNPERIHKIIEAVRQWTPSHIPVTAKVRLGFGDKSLCQEIALAVEAGGAQRITIHARTKEEAYRPPAHWEYIAKMKEVIKNIEVVANGDLWTPQEIKKCLQITNCNSIALGRSAMASPFLALVMKQKIEFPLPAHTWSFLLDFTQKSIVQYGNNYTLRRVKQWMRFIQQIHPWAQAGFEKIKVQNDVQGVLDFFVENKNFGSLIDDSQFPLLSHPSDGLLAKKNNMGGVHTIIPFNKIHPLH